jgi:hypothetical protein
VRLNGKVDRDAHLSGDEIVVGPEARIGGDLSHRARKVEIDPAAVVAGQIIAIEPPAHPDFEAWGVKAAAAVAIFAFAFLVGMGFLVVVIVIALPALMNSARTMIVQKPLSTLGLGFLISIAAPVVIAFLFATIFGIPLALLIAVLCAAAAPLAIAASAYFVGIGARRMMTKNAETPHWLARAMWSALAAFALVVIGLVPVLGGLVWVIAYIIGLGAIMTRGGKALAFKA